MSTLIAQAVASRRFESARRLDQATSRGQIPGLHGHGFIATAHADVDAGWAPYAGGEVAALQREVDRCVALLDYRFLNDVVDEPSDEGLARWLLPRLDLPAVARVAVQSTARQGIDLDASGQAQLWRRYRFESAHQLPNVPAGHKCGRMHGHGFEVIVRARQDARSAKQRLGYDHLDAAWQPLQAELDHRCLNDVPGLENPTSELLASWLWRRLAEALPGLSAVAVYETARSGASFDGERYRIWKDFDLDSAVRVRHAPPGDLLREVHGHTFTLRLAIAAPLDDVMGWTIDFGDVKQIFQPLYELLDHQPLHELPGLDDASTTAIAHWVHAQASRVLPQLAGVDLYEREGCGVVVACDRAGPHLPVWP